MKKEIKKLQEKIKKYYKIILPSFSILMSSFGLALSFLGFKYDENDKKIIFFVLIVSEIFLVITTIYSVISLFRGIITKSSLDAKNDELSTFRRSRKTILENNKTIVTTYKDFSDMLKMLKKEYLESDRRLREFYNSSSSVENTEETKKYIEEEREREHNRIKDVLISHYNRFLSTTTNLLRLNVKDYILTKGCDADVSIAIKQLYEPTLYTEINRNDVNIYTTFRDSKTYGSKKRNETWEKTFKISKNSDFVMSIEKDYYIFNFMDKNYLEDGLYQNENAAFYENYNSGVTCTMYSCVNGKRKLFGYLACDSLVTKSNKLTNKNVYDWEVANIMMFAANIVAMFLENFLTIWDDIYVDFDDNLEDWAKSEFGSSSTTKADEKEHNSNIDSIKKEKYNFCKTMIELVNGTRYNR